MADIKVYKTQDLILQVKKNFDHSRLKLDQWENFIDLLCGDREYQKESIKAAIIYIASGEYGSIEDLVTENWASNPELQKRYKNLREYLEGLQLPHKFSGVIDLATGTGKSYVMYGIAQIALGIGLVDKVIVLCPSLTIESGLKDKFQSLSGDDRIKTTLPQGSIYKNPRIIDANSTIMEGDIAIENIHAVYERTGSSIHDSLQDGGQRVLVLSDEVHHAYNSSSDSDIKKWKAFLLSSVYNFKYLLGFTGTAYRDDEYFNDVIYRYSIRQAVNDHVVKLVDYVAKDESLDINDKFQKIYDNHEEFVQKYRLVKPLTIFVTKDIPKAISLREDLIDFLMKHEKVDRAAIEEKVLIVTSHKDHKKNISKLKKVDDVTNPVEWIVSVSMLTEGWDVKNVFQIVPWEDRAFNSKLLISQVLGRGLRVPEKYKSPQPKVRVFNHDAWSKNIRGLIDEVLEKEVRIESFPLKTGDRAKYHFQIYNVDYTKREKEIQAKTQTLEFDYSKGYTNLVAQIEEVEEITEYEDLWGVVRDKSTIIHRQTQTIDEVVNKIADAFRVREFEARIRFPKGTYEKEHLPPESEIRAYVQESMRRVGIKSGVLSEDNANRIYKAFQTLFRKRGSTVTFERITKAPSSFNTTEMERESIAVGNVRHGATIFYTDEFKKECDEQQIEILEDIIADQTLPRSSSREVNHHYLKTPLSIVLTKQEPERKFVEKICEQKVADKIDAWVKSRDQGFYSIEYSWRKGEHQTQSSFNPDFFIKKSNYIVVIEVKADGDTSDENRAKYRWAKQHFLNLNDELQTLKIDQKYFFHFLSPHNYNEFFEYLSDGRLFKGEFRSELEDELEEINEPS